jgi:DNA-directed RNA polymerase II subunit RPB9
MAARRLKFCPETNDLLYPKEDKDTRRLIYRCKNCDYYEQAEVSDYCVYVSENKRGEKVNPIIQQDVRNDPTLPRTKDVRCPQCNHNEAVFFSQNTESGMTLYFNCVSCGHKWRDYV